MIERVRRIKSEQRESGGNYFSAPKRNLKFIPTGCKTLDLALGGGWAFNRIANIVGDKCLSGDTIVHMRRGRGKPMKISMEKLYNRVKGKHFNKHDGLKTYLMSDLGGYVGMQEMLDIIKTGDKVVYLITDDRGNTIKATKDHKFKTDRGWLTLADGLGVGDQVRRWRKTKTVDTPDRAVKDRSCTYSIPYHPYAWRHCIGGRDYKRMLTARLVIEAAMNGLTFDEFVNILRKKPKEAARLAYSDPRMEVHHADNDAENDDLDNLRLLSPEEHWSVHAASMPKNTKRLDWARITSIQRLGKEPTYDITMKGPHHNFIANGFEVHNSTGKTLQMIEACANFYRLYGGDIYYRETESAFDREYAAEIGMPIEAIDFGEDDVQLETVEDMFEDLGRIIESRMSVKKRKPALYILDSLDALSDRAELDRAMDKGSYGAQKAKNLSQLFRRLVRRLSDADITVLIVSQVRDKIGVTFGRKTTRSGGRALDFYATHVVYLAHLGNITKTVSGIRRPVGIRVKAKIDKNKIALPFREADYVILFGYGVDDALASLAWCKEAKCLKDAPVEISGATDEVLKKAAKSMSAEQLKELNDFVTRRWYEIEKSFLPRRKKYA